ncbi:MAG: hypothetical protein HFI64_09755 [Lachnospiraceae bacterium]|nr:hypothetical protein [Lachnospiraceae bacterium]
MHKEMKDKIWKYIKVFTALYWGAILEGLESYYIPYLIVLMSGSVCFIFNYLKNDEILTKPHRIITNCYSILLSALVTLANYRLFLDMKISDYAGFGEKVYQVSSAAVFFIGGFAIFKEIFLAIHYKVSDDRVKPMEKAAGKIKDWWVLVGVWGIITAVNVLIMFLAKYPGNLSADSLVQIAQCNSGRYTNHHPYYHTQIIHLLLSLGYQLFGNMNAAVATYSVFSILVMAFCFAYITYTIYQIKHNLFMTICVFIWYLAMPFHILYSFTMWKDVFWGAMVAMFAVAAFRTLKNIGERRWTNYVVLFGSAVGVSLLRSNGWFVFVLSTILFGIMFWKSHKKVFIVFCGIVVFSWVLKHPVMSALGVKQPDLMEGLSIPSQQIARVIADGKELTAEQEETLGQIVDIDAIPETYDKYIYDPIKLLVQSQGNQNYIAENKWEFIKLYAELGLSYPHKYVEAWADATKGYWNGGYPYWRWHTRVDENKFGIERIVHSESAERIFEGYLRLFEDVPLLQLFLSIGFHVWLIIISTYAALVKKEYAALFVAVPFLMVIASLCVASPVFSEFRYAYAIFCGVPFVMAAATDDGYVTDNER